MPPTRNRPPIGVTATRASVKMVHSVGNCLGFAMVRLYPLPACIGKPRPSSFARSGDQEPAANTQFHKDLTLNLDGFSKHLEALIDSRVTGLIVCGSLGENQSLDPEEKRTVLKRAIEVAKGRVPVLSGVAETSTLAACRYVADGEKLGASGYMVMPAMVYKADSAEAENHFRRVGAATHLPWMLYNNPVGYSVDITPPQFAKLSDIKNLVALKESSANTRRITELRIEVECQIFMELGGDSGENALPFGL